MASTFTRSGLEKIGIGEQENTWGTTRNGTFDMVEEMINGVLTLDVSGDQDVTLTDAQLRHAVILLTGTLTDDIAIIWPAGEEYAHKVRNGTDGAFTVTLQESGGSGFVLPQGEACDVFNDGTNDVEPVVQGVTGGGSGAQTAAGARAAFGVQHNNANMAYAAVFYS